MARILCIDYGLKRTGIAVTDPLKIIASGLTALDTKDVLPFLRNYFQQEQVELILLGEPKNLDDTDTHATSLVEEFQKKLQKERKNRVLTRKRSTYLKTRVNPTPAVARCVSEISRNTFRDLTDATEPPAIHA